MNECRKLVDLWVGSCHNTMIVGIGIQSNISVYADEYEKMRTLDILGTCCPICGSGIVVAMSPDVYIEEFGVTRKGDHVVFGSGCGVAGTGSPTVFANDP